MTPGGLLRRHTDFRRLWFADGFSQLGTQISTLALPLTAAKAAHASTLQVAVLAALQSVAFLAFGLPVGAWSDRWRRRPLIVNADVGRAVLLGSIPVAALLGDLTIWQLYAVALAVGGCAVFFDVAYQSYLPTIVERPLLLQANSRLEVNRSAAAVGGPILAGYLVQWLTAPVAIAVDAVSFLWSAAWIASIDTAEPKPAPAPRAPLRRQIAEGLRFVRADAVLRAIAAYNGVAMTCYSAQGALEVIFLLRVVHASPVLIGLLFAGGCVGNLLGALCAAPLTRALGRRRALPAYVLLGGASALLLPLTDDGWRIVLFPLGTALSGFCLVAYNVVQMSLRQETCPPHLLGRVSATMRTITAGVRPLGALLGGLLGTWLGIRPTLWITAACALAAGLLLLGMATTDDGAPPPAADDVVSGGPGDEVDLGKLGRGGGAADAR